MKWHTTTGNNGNAMTCTHTVDSGQNYRVPSNVSTLRGAPPGPRGTSAGKRMCVDWVNSEAGSRTPQFSVETSEVLGDDRLDSRG